MKYLLPLILLLLCRPAFTQSSRPADSMMVPAPNPAPALPGTIPYHEEKEDKRWKLVYDAIDEKLLYDTKVFKKKIHGIVSVWIKNVPSIFSIFTIRDDKMKEHQTYEKASYNYHGYDRYSHALRKEEYDCNNKRMRITAFFEYDEEGNLLSSEEIPDAEWNSVVPDTIGESVLNFFCK